MTTLDFKFPDENNPTTTFDPTVVPKLDSGVWDQNDNKFADIMGDGETMYVYGSGAQSNEYGLLLMAMPQADLDALQEFVRVTDGQAFRAKLPWSDTYESVKFGVGGYVRQYVMSEVGNGTWDVLLRLRRV